MPGLNWVRRGLQVAEWVSPSVAAAMADGLFFLPIGAKVRDSERAVLDRGERFTLQVGANQVAGWSWGSGPTVLLAHGWAGHAGQMTGLVPSLLEAGFRAVALDMPGHGESQGRTSSVVHFADAVVAAHEKFGPFVGAVAHSLGAGALTYAIARGLPLEKAVFFAPPAHFEQFWTRFRDSLGVGPELWGRMQARAEARLGVRFDDILPVRHAPHLSTRLLVFHDEHDKEIPISSGEALVAVWKDATLVRTRGMGHLKLLKDPSLAAQTAAFFKGQ